MGKSYVFGPVPSRRLGLSLGVDIVPMKSCTLDCVYCQLGRSSDLTVERGRYADIDEVATELREKLKTVARPDHITISGSGEPTLHTEIGVLVGKIKQFTDVPVAIMTNGTLFSDPEVRRNCLGADVVLPSLDASDGESFAKINRPHKSLHFEKIVEGLIEFRREYAGQIWLEIFVIEGVNTSDRQIEMFGELISLIKPDKVQLNTAVRPTTEKGIMPVSPWRMAEIAEAIGHGAEVIADFDKKIAGMTNSSPEAVLEMLVRRPCSIDDIAAGLNISIYLAKSYVLKLLGANKIQAVEKPPKTYYMPK